eukprot:1620327-Pleurochrysis_carterae.AAC.1
MHCKGAPNHPTDRLRYPHPSCLSPLAFGALCALSRLSLQSPDPLCSSSACPTSYAPAQRHFSAEERGADSLIKRFSASVSTTEKLAEVLCCLLTVFELEWSRFHT